MGKTASTAYLSFLFFMRKTLSRLNGLFDRPSQPCLAQGGCVGHLESAFGKAGRFKARFPAGSSVKVRGDVQC